MRSFCGWLTVPRATSHGSALTSVVLGSLYGMTLAEEKDPNVEVFEKGLESVEFLISNSSWLEYLPIQVVESLPTWLPGMGVIRQLAEIREAVMTLRDIPWEYAKNALVRPASCAR